MAEMAHRMTCRQNDLRNLLWLNISWFSFFSFFWPTCFTINAKKFVFCCISYPNILWTSHSLVMCCASTRFLTSWPPNLEAKAFLFFSFICYWIPCCPTPNVLIPLFNLTVEKKKRSEMHLRIGPRLKRLLQGCFASEISFWHSQLPSHRFNYYSVMLPNSSDVLLDAGYVGHLFFFLVSPQTKNVLCFHKSLTVFQLLLPQTACFYFNTKTPSKSVYVQVHG